MVITSNSPCIMLRREKRKFAYPAYGIDTDLCRGCKACLEIGCPCISWVEGAGQTKDGHKRKGTVSINKETCVGCEVCTQICKFDAIVPVSK